MSPSRSSATFIVPEDQLEWSFARSSGPGGQNVNKVSSKATLRWKPCSDLLTPGALKRFQIRAKRYLTDEGLVVIQSQEHRDRLQNMQSCRIKLQTMLEASVTPPKRRVSTRPTKASRLRRLDNKKRQSDKKSGRRVVD
ncbi:MAG: aminoacyl-tRNA hydrolase [Pirellulaceae bacterium]|nr:aminoacyl-tRNA hydrolase [Pirellulaceae bacterium]